MIPRKNLATKIGEAIKKWLEENDNLDMWHDSISVKKRRILMTQWTGEAWKKLSSDKTFAKKLFMKTGCLMTADGSDDDMIKPQGLEPYSFYIFVLLFIANYNIENFKKGNRLIALNWS